MKFDLDSIDETDRLEETLKPRVESFGGKVEKIALTGNHITPCIPVTSSFLQDLLFSACLSSYRNKENSAATFAMISVLLVSTMSSLRNAYFGFIMYHLMITETSIIHPCIESENCSCILCIILRFHRKTM